MVSASLGTLGDYRLVQLLGQGGMGEVYLACREGPEGFFKEVVIKCMHKHLAADQGFVDLFLNEARLSVLLQHPNIVQTLELNREKESWFIVMELVRGRSLKACIRRAKKSRRRIPEAISVWLIAEALQGLHFTHSLSDNRGRPLGILHRDISPDNLLLGWDGSVKLLDFGISKARFRHMDLPTGGLKGKFAYMAPEYSAGNAADIRSDIYSMGVSLHELLTLELPDCVPRSRQSMGEPRSRYRPHESLSEELNGILSKALEPEPAARWASAAQMAGALIQSLVAKGQSVHASTVSVWMRGFWDLSPDETFFELESHSGASSLSMEESGHLKPVTEKLADPGEVAQEAWVLQSIRNQRTPRQKLMRGLSLAACGISICLLYWTVISSPRPLQPPLVPLAALPEAAPEASTGAVFAESLALLGPLKLPLVEATPRAEEAPVGMGLVRIRAAPNTFVSHQGKRLGKTPMKPVQLPAGPARLHLHNKRLGLSKYYQVQVEAGEEVVLQAGKPRAKTAKRASSGAAPTHAPSKRTPRHKRSTTPAPQSTPPASNARSRA